MKKIVFFALLSLCSMNLHAETTNDRDKKLTVERTIVIKDLRRKTIELNVTVSDTIESVKQKIQAKWSIPVVEQWLIYAGRELENDKTLFHYVIPDGAEIHLIPKTNKQ